MIHATLKVSEHGMTQTCPSDFFADRFRLPLYVFM